MRSALGKGLAQLMGEQTVGATQSLPLNLIEPNAEQPRRHFDDSALQELAESVRVHGVLQPIVVRPIGHDRYGIIAGERRWRAAKLAGLDSVPVIVRASDPKTTLEIALVENLQREDIGVLESAAAYQRLNRDFGLTQDDIAARVGKSRVAVTNAMRLLRLPPDVLDLLARGELSEGHARALLMTGNESRQSWLARKIVVEGLTVRQAEELARLESPRRDRTPKHRDADWEHLENTLSERLGAPTKVIRGAKSGRIVIGFATDDELERLVGLLGADGPEMA